MAEVIGMSSGNVERFPGAHRATSISEELSRITALVRNACPLDTIIMFTFDGHLQVHIDVRKREHVLVVEMILPTLEPGLFQNISIGGTPRHPFYHRISARVQA